MNSRDTMGRIRLNGGGESQENLNLNFNAEGGEDWLTRRCRGAEEEWEFAWMGRMKRMGRFLNGEGEETIGSRRDAEAQRKSGWGIISQTTIY